MMHDKSVRTKVLNLVYDSNPRLKSGVINHLE
jgi:hypothetical protein